MINCFVLFQMEMKATKNIKWHKSKQTNNEKTGFLFILGGLICNSINEIWHWQEFDWKAKHIRIFSF